MECQWGLTTSCDEVNMGKGGVETMDSDMDENESKDGIETASKDMIRERKGRNGDRNGEGLNKGKGIKLGVTARENVAAGMGGRVEYVTGDGRVEVNKKNHRESGNRTATDLDKEVMMDSKWSNEETDEINSSTSNGLENFNFDEETPELFNSDGSTDEIDNETSSTFETKEQEDDLEIPAFLRRQKN